MDEQPVAFATSSRSPNNWLSNFTYGVSPHPAHAPENSNSGCSNCTSFTIDGFRSFRPISGSFRKKSQFALSASRKGGCACMLIAFLLTSLLLFTGHTCTCLLYTSDAADERSSVDLGGR